MSLTDNVIFSGFLEKVKTGKAHVAGSGFGGKGLDRLEKERDAKEKAERKAYGEAEAEEKVEGTAAEEAAPQKESKDEMTFGNFKVEVKRGPAPDSSKLGIMGAAAEVKRILRQKEEEKMQTSLRQAEEAAARAGKDTAAYKQAQSVIAKLNGQIRAHRLVTQSQAAFEAKGGQVKDPDATDFHAIIPINDYPQKARWRVTNKETMSQVTF